MSKRISGVVYCYTSPSGKKYIGQTIREGRRKSDHRLAASNNPFHNAVRKYGIDNMLYEVLHKNVTSMAELNRLEEEEIGNHKAIFPDGYNLKSGGENNFMNEGTKEKIRQKAYGRKISEETRQKLRDSHTGKPFLAISKQKLRDAHTGVDKGQAFRDKMKEIRNRPEMIAKVKQVHIGRKATGQALENIRNGHWTQKILCLTTGKLYNSIKEASEDTGVCSLSISKGARGLVESRNYRWQYVG